MNYLERAGTRGRAVALLVYDVAPGRFDGEITPFVSSATSKSRPRGGLHSLTVNVGRSPAGTSAVTPGATSYAGTDHAGKGRF